MMARIRSHSKHLSIALAPYVLCLAVLGVGLVSHRNLSWAGFSDV
jgi:hypothetical protein